MKTLLIVVWISFIIHCTWAQSDEEIAYKKKLQAIDLVDNGKYEEGIKIL